MKAQTSRDVVIPLDETINGAARSTELVPDVPLDDSPGPTALAASVPAADLLPALFASSLLILGLTLVGKLLGVFQQSVFAAVFASNHQLDTLFVALAIPNMIVNVILFGTLSTSLIPIYDRERVERGPVAAAEFATAMTVVTTAILVVVTGLAAVFAEQLVRTLAPGFDSGQVAEATLAVRLILPSVVISGVAAVVRAISFAHHRFLAPLAAFNAMSAAIALFVLWLAPKFGLASVAVGMTVGSLLTLLPIFVSHAGRQFATGVSLSMLRRAGASIAPVFTGMTVVALLVEAIRQVARAYASMEGPGRIATLEYGLAFEKIVVGTFAIAIATATYPLLTRAASDGNTLAFKSVLVRATRYTIVTVLPLSIAVVVSRDLITQMWLQHGAFTSKDAAAVAHFLIFLSPALVAWALMQVLVYALISTKSVRTLVWTQAFHAAIAIGLYGLLTSRLGLDGIGLAISISAVATLLLMGRLVGRSYLTDGVGLRVASFVARCIVAGSVMAAAGIAATRLLAEGHSPRLVGLSAVIAVDVVVFAAVAAALRITEVNRLVGECARIMGRIARR